MRSATVANAPRAASTARRADSACSTSAASSSRAVARSAASASRSAAAAASVSTSCRRCVVRSSRWLTACFGRGDRGRREGVRRRERVGRLSPGAGGGVRVRRAGHAGDLGGGALAGGGGVLLALRVGQIVVGDRLVDRQGRVRVRGGPAHGAGLAVDERGGEFARVTCQSTPQQRGDACRRVFECDQRGRVRGLGLSLRGGESLGLAGGREAIGDLGEMLARRRECPRRGGVHTDVLVELDETLRESGPAGVDPRQQLVELGDPRPGGGDRRLAGFEPVLVSRRRRRDGEVAGEFIDADAEGRGIRRFALRDPGGECDGLDFGGSARGLDRVRGGLDRGPERLGLARALVHEAIGRQPPRTAPRASRARSATVRGAPASHAATSPPDAPPRPRGAQRRRHPAPSRACRHGTPHAAPRGRPHRSARRSTRAELRRR